MNGNYSAHLENIPTFASGNEEGRVHAVIETPRNIRYKYAFDHKLGVFRLRSTLPEGLQWPYDYGFIPQTLADDGDPLDILVLTDIPTFTGCLMEARVLGVVRLAKDGVENDRILAAPTQVDGVSQPSDAFADVDDVPKNTLDDISRFLIEYSQEQGHTIEFKGVRNKKKALRTIEAAIEAFVKQSG